jgi:hypothetical protein
LEASLVPGVNESPYLLYAVERSDLRPSISARGILPKFNSKQTETRVLILIVLTSADLYKGDKLPDVSKWNSEQKQKFKDPFVKTADLRCAIDLLASGEDLARSNLTTVKRTWMHVMPPSRFIMIEECPC